LIEVGGALVVAASRAIWCFSIKAISFRDIFTEREVAMQSINMITRKASNTSTTEPRCEWRRRSEV
jgi:hypothetical protein